MSPPPTRLLIAVLLAGTSACARAPVSREGDALTLLRMEAMRPAMSLGPPVRVEQRTRPTGLRFDVMPERARVFVDGRAVGLARQLGRSCPWRRASIR